jgi:hypothetical protein
MSSMPTAERGTTRHWLLPHERWFARFGDRVRARRAAEPPNPQALRFQQNYGPDGQVLIEAALVDLIAAGVLGIGGGVLAAVTEHGIPATAGSWLQVVGILVGAITAVRAIQLSRAGRVFRAGRPFTRLGKPMP